MTGRGGQLGRCLVESVQADPTHELLASWSHAELDVCDRQAVTKLFAALPGGPPDVLVNAAAFTAVDRCESEEALALAVNGEAPGQLAALCADHDVGFVHVSTDYVFSGHATRPYSETAEIDPRGAYGRTKAEGERSVLAALPGALIVRTSWVFGPGKNFVGAILRQARLRRAGEVDGPLRVVADQRGAPTYAADLADGILALCSLAERGDETQGFFHLSNQGDITWWDFARAILDDTGHQDLEIERITTDELSLPAPRPQYSVLDGGRAAALGVKLRGWREALAAHLASPAGAALVEDAA
ncbi:MAG: dTDP-4-dehydrorhamnose reductase [Deltaproteobacteria bacterium]|nr:dTDP-4-dehydrorhamnose reductase [Deltaproteobacteria bacterium]MBW2696401.1 dTDP-4-dehydrorhamnose reductase [Deltaproteobacteria bacterium]